MGGPNLLVPLRLVPAVKKSLTPFLARLRGNGGFPLTRPYEFRIARRQRYSTVTLQSTFGRIWPAEATDASITGRWDRAAAEHRRRRGSGPGLTD